MKRDPLMVHVAIPQAAPQPAAPEVKKKSLLVRISIVVFIIIVAFVLIRGGGDKKAGTVAKEVVPPPQEQASDSGNAVNASRPNAENGPAAAVDSPQSISYITAEPQRPKLGDTITISPVTTRADMEAPVPAYEWRKNGEKLFNNTNMLKLTDEFRRGDKVEAVVAYDGGAGGRKQWNVSAVIINTPPEIISATPVVKTGENRFSFRVNAKDADGDPLTFSLSPPVEGASIDKATGEVVFTVPQGKKGPISFSVNATDGQGGNASYNVALEMAPEKK